MDYKKINAAFNKVFFDGRHASNPVYLDPDSRNLAEIARELVVPQSQVAETIGNAVSNTLLWGSRNPYSRHLGELNDWEQSNSAGLPPFTALLGCFAIAAERMRGDEHFSANNFYQRLAEVFGVSEGATRELLSAGNQTSVFWEALNKWLVANDYAFGQPTAHPLYEHKPYVGYAISQSLVRDVDRKRFHTLFDCFRLTKDDNITIGEMSVLVEQWIAGANGPTETLRKLSRHPGVKDRIAEAALQELSTYDPTEHTTGGETNSAARLFWVIVEKTFPRRQVTPYMATSREGVAGCSLTESGPYRIGSDLAFFPLGVTGLSCLVSATPINHSVLLLAPVEVQDGTGRRFAHTARSIVPLQKREGDTFFREAQRVIPLVSHSILCHENSGPAVREYLSVYAAKGFEIVRGTVGSFPPEGWILIHNVRIIRAPLRNALEELKDLQDLVILTQGDAISLESGIQLARGIWHADEPPDVFVATGDPRARIRLTEDDIELTVRDVQSHDIRFLREISTRLVGHNLAIELVSGNGRKLASDRISFRSADFPRWQHEPLELCYDLSTSAAEGVGLSATRAIPARWIRGFLTKGIDEVSLARCDSTFDEAITEFPADTSEDPLEDITVISTYKEGGIVESCVLRGYHMWLAASDNMSRTCKACGAFVLMRDLRSHRKRGRRLSRSKVHQDAHQRSESPGVPAPIFTGSVQQQMKAISPNTTFDAVCYSRSGNWAQLQKLLSSACSDHLEVFKYCRALTDLGHLDIMLDDDFVRPSAWSVAPPCFVVTGSGTAYLSGFRSGNLFKQICDRLGSRDAGIAKVPQSVGPDCIRFDVEGVTAMELQERLVDLKDALGRGIHVAEMVGLRLACALPSSSQIADHLKRVHVDPGARLQSFDLATGRWTDSRLLRPGAYRDHVRGNTYLFFNGDYVASGPFELVKLLAAKLAGRRLHAYDARKQNFSCVLGCEPPGLFRRALISCTGLLPQVEDRLLVYKNVPEDLGHTVLNKLYG